MFPMIHHKLLYFIRILHFLVDADTPAYAQHRAALAASPNIQPAVAELLLEHALPHLAAAVEEEVVDWGSDIGTSGLLYTLASSLGADSLQPALRHHMLQAGGAALVQQAARVVRAVPLEPPEGVPRYSLAGAHHNAAKLLRELCLLLTSATGQPGSQAAASSTAEGRADLEAAGWQVVGLVPHMAAVIQALAAGSSSSSESQQALHSTCYLFADALFQQDKWRTSIGSQQQLEAWAASLDAGMQLLPLLRQLDGSWRQQGDLSAVRLHTAALMAARMVLRMLHVGSTGAWVWAVKSGNALRADARASLAAQLAQLHSRSRLLHWLAAGDNRTVLRGEGSAAEWDLLQELLCRQLAAAASLLPEGQDSRQPGHARWACRFLALHVCP